MYTKNLSLETLTIATPEQMHDLLNLHEIGQAAFEDHVNYLILRSSSTDAPCRRRRLQTFSSTKKNKKKLKQIDRERKKDAMHVKKAFS